MNHKLNYVLYSLDLAIIMVSINLKTSTNIDFLWRVTQPMV